MFQRLGRLEEEVTELSPVGHRGYTEEASQAGPGVGNGMWGQQSHYLSEASLFNRAQPCPSGWRPCLGNGSLV